MKDRILATAMQLAEDLPFHCVTRHHIAGLVPCAPSLVTWYFKSMDKLRDAVLTRAIETNNARILAWAIAAGHPGASLASPKLKRAALKIIGQ